VSLLTLLLGAWTVLKWDVLPTCGWTPSLPSRFRWVRWNNTLYAMPQTQARGKGPSTPVGVNRCNQQGTVTNSPVDIHHVK